MPASNGHFRVPSDTGLLLVGHGSREAVGREEFLATAELLGSLVGQTPVAPCFLELAAPTIAAGVAALAHGGARRIVVVPVLLFAAGHAKRDIPAAVAAALADRPGTSVEQCPHLGCHEAIVELSRLRYERAIGEGGLDADTTLVIVGRGSHDAEATAEMGEFVCLRAENMAAEVRACFVAMAQPGLNDTLDLVAARGPRRVVVQPHFLFGGVLVDRIGQTVAEYRERYPHIEWIVTEHLGPSPLVAKAILGRLGQTLSRS